MANKGLVAISYCFAFLAVYIGSLSYAFIAKGLEEVAGVLLPQSAAMDTMTSNAVVANATMGISSFAGVNGWLGIGIVMAIITVLLVLMSQVKMRAAIN